MKFTNVEIENFLAIGEATFRLDGLGLVHVSGSNNDQTSAVSNGSGKSSIADAIHWCLWGSTARGESGDFVVNTRAAKNCRVSITIDDEGELYRIDRHRKYAKHKNGLLLFRFDGGAWTDITKGTNALTQKAIERLLGCSEEVFKAAVYSGQEEMPDIPKMTDRQLKILVEQAAGVDVLASAYDIARDRARKCAEKRAHAQISVDRATQRHQDSIASLTRLRDQSQQWDANQANKIANLKLQTTTALASFNQAKDELDPAGEQQLRDDIADAQGKIAAVTDERQREQVLAGDVTTARGALSQLQARLAAATTSASAAASAVTAAEQRAKDIEQGVGKPCDSCNRPLEKAHLKAAVEAANAVIQAAKQRRQEALDAQAAIEKRIPVAEKMVTGSEQALTDHRACMTDVSAEGDRLKNLQRELQRVEAMKSEVERLRLQAQNVANNWKAEAAAENPFKVSIAQADTTVVQCADDVTQSAAERAAAIEEEEYAQAVVEVFAPAGVRAHRLDEATPFLNDRTAHYLGSLADGQIDAFWTTLSETKSKGNLIEKFSVTVESPDAPSFGNLSGGEKRKVRLACALALQDLVATRAAKSIELWIGDEIDDALDPAGLERLMGVLEEKARDRGTVLVVSHNDIAHYARQSILVEKTNGRATVTIQ